MKFENEITVEVDTNLDNLILLLTKHNFKLKEKYSCKDIYMIHKSEKINSNYLELLKKCVLVRNLILSSGEKKLLTYKYKEYDEYKNIIRQAKLNLNVDDINTLVEILKLVDFIELIKINDDILVYSNDIDEINIQCVNNKHIYIEIESKCNYIDKIYKTIDMKNVIKKYNIPIKGENYFVKKAENEFKETYQNS